MGQIEASRKGTMKTTQNRPPHSNWRFACPVCGQLLLDVNQERAYCHLDELSFEFREGIWHFLPSEREAALHQFISEYETVRRDEGRGSQDADYYEALPFKDLSGRAPAEWRERARSFKALKSISNALEPLTHPFPSFARYKILDLGAGNGWLSNQLAKMGNAVAAVDLSLDSFDGLGAHRHYETPFLSVCAEYDHLPFYDSEADIVIFNASFHYSPNPVKTLGEVLRVLKQEGRIFIIDTPVYHEAEIGKEMVAEREALFQDRYGFQGNAHGGVSFLTYQQMDALATDFGLIWQRFDPIPAWRRLVRQIKVSINQQREPAQFPIYVGYRSWAQADQEEADVD